MGHGQPRQNPFRVGDPLRRRFRAVRFIAVLSDRAGTTHFRRRHGHRLGRLPRNDSADAHAGKISRSGDGCFSTQQPRSPSAGANETGFIVPLIGAREATFAGGIIISVMTLLTVWRVPEIVKFRWDQIRQAAQGTARLRRRNESRTKPSAGAVLNFTVAMIQRGNAKKLRQRLVGIG